MSSQQSHCEKSLFDFSIRWKMQNWDLPDMLKIEKASYVEESSWSREDIEHFTGDYGNHWCNEYSTYVAHCNEMVVGFILFRHVNDVFEIINIAVHPLYRRNKVGQSLIEKIFEARNPKNTFVEVSEYNDIAILLYLKCGFKAVDTRKRDGDTYYIFHRGEEISDFSKYETYGKFDSSFRSN